MVAVVVEEEDAGTALRYNPAEGRLTAPPHNKDDTNTSNKMAATPSLIELFFVAFFVTFMSSKTGHTQTSFYMYI